MKNSFYIDLQRFMLIPTKFPLTPCSPKNVYLCVSDTLTNNKSLKWLRDLLFVEIRLAAKLLY